MSVRLLPRTPPPPPEAHALPPSTPASPHPRSEVEAREAGRIENVRRRHNFIPLLMELARQLARKAALTPLLQAARVKLAAARERARAAGHEGE